MCVLSKRLQKGNFAALWKLVARSTILLTRADRAVLAGQPSLSYPSLRRFVIKHCGFTGRGRKLTVHLDEVPLGEIAQVDSFGSDSNTHGSPQSAHSAMGGEPRAGSGISMLSCTSFTLSAPTTSPYTRLGSTKNSERTMSNTEEQISKVHRAGFLSPSKPGDSSSPIPIADYAMKVVKLAGVAAWTKSNAPGIPLLAARVASLLPWAPFVLSYFTAVMESIEQITESSRRHGYCEGYAITMMFLSLGRSVQDVMYLDRSGTDYRIIKSSPTWERPEVSGPGDPRVVEQKLWDSVTGFFEGKAAAIKAMEEFNKKSPATANADIFSGIFRACANRVNLDLEPIFNDEYVKRLYSDYSARLPRSSPR